MSMAAIFLPSAAASGTRKPFAKAPTTSTRRCGCSRNRTAPARVRERPPMSLRVFAFTCGQLTGEFAHLMEGGEGRIRLPIPAYLIEHPNGTALFDTGMHPDCQHDPAGRLGPRLAGLFDFDYGPGEEIGARLEAIDRDPAKIDLIINSHFHFDHVGGNALIPNATMLVQRHEWDAGMEPDAAANRGFNPRDFDLGHKLRLLDGEHDVFG